MKINVIDIGVPEGFQPIVCGRKLKDCPVGGTTLKNALTRRIEDRISKVSCSDSNKYFNIRADFWPSIDLIGKMLASELEDAVVYVDPNTRSRITGHGPRTTDIVPLTWISSTEEIAENPKKIELDEKSKILSYSWDLLFVNEELIGGLEEDRIEGVVRNGATIDGKVIIGEGTVLLPGVYIEGNAIIGKNCKIGPNCYIRGNTHIGDNCHVGQSVEIKNSILMDNVSVGHLSYVGDSIIGERTNLGAGTTVANLRHDGKNHKSTINGKQIDTGRRKLGMLVGDDVHTGINTTIYPEESSGSEQVRSPEKLLEKTKWNVEFIITEDFRNWRYSCKNP